MSLFVNNFEFNVVLDGAAAVPSYFANPQQKFDSDGKLQLLKVSDDSAIGGYFKGFSLDGLLLGTSR